MLSAVLTYWKKMCSYNQHPKGKQIEVKGEVVPLLVHRGRCVCSVWCELPVHNTNCFFSCFLCGRRGFLVSNPSSIITSVCMYTLTHTHYVQVLTYCIFKQRQLFTSTTHTPALTHIKRRRLTPTATDRSFCTVSVNPVAHKQGLRHHQTSLNP